MTGHENKIVHRKSEESGAPQVFVGVLMSLVVIGGMTSFWFGYSPKPRDVVDVVMDCLHENDIVSKLQNGDVSELDIKEALKSCPELKTKKK